MRNQSPIDLITLDQSLRSRGVSDEVGGFAYLAELSNNTRTPLIFWLMQISCARKPYYENLFR